MSPEDQADKLWKENQAREAWIARLVKIALTANQAVYVWKEARPMAGIMNELDEALTQNAAAVLAHRIETLGFEKAFECED